VLFHELGQDLVLALQLGFKPLDLLVLGILDGLGLARAIEGQVRVLEEELLPGIEDVGLDAELITQVGKGLCPLSDYAAALQAP
jgi:hypothetical protein